jgi:hypothetical protein
MISRSVPLSMERWKVLHKFSSTNGNYFSGRLRKHATCGLPACQVVRKASASALRRVNARQTRHFGSRGDLVCCKTSAPHLLGLLLDALQGDVSVQPMKHDFAVWHPVNRNFC